MKLPKKLPSLAARLVFVTVLSAQLVCAHAQQAPAPTPAASQTLQAAKPLPGLPASAVGPQALPPVRANANTSVPTAPTLDCAWLSERGSNPEVSTLAKPLRQDSRLVVFPYDKNAIYPIYTNYNRFTHFEFEQGESILGVYLNDETEWEFRVSATGYDLFIRPRQRAVSGSVTVISSRRRYEMDLMDVQGCALPRYQRVSWFISEGVYEDRDAIAKLNTSRGNHVRGAQELGESAPLPTGQALRDAAPLSVASPSNVTSLPTSLPISPLTSPSTGAAFAVNLQNLNSNYVIEGDAELAPEQVMDDGTRTWFKFRAAARRPALFLVNPDGMAETVEYATQGSYFVAARVFPHGILLKDGKQEVRIRNKASTCGWFDAQCKSVAVKNISSN